MSAPGVPVLSETFTGSLNSPSPGKNAGRAAVGGGAGAGAGAGAGGLVSAAGVDAGIKQNAATTMSNVMCFT
jgi:hypothetical protein